MSKFENVHKIIVSMICGEINDIECANKVLEVLKKIKKTEKKALENAFEIVYLVDDMLDQVIATGGFSERDMEIKEKCTSFIDFYIK